MNNYKEQNTYNVCRYNDLLEELCLTQQGSVQEIQEVLQQKTFQVKGQTLEQPVDMKCKTKCMFLFDCETR